VRRPVFIGDICALVRRQRILDADALAEGEELDSNILSQSCVAFRVGSLRSRYAATHPIGFLRTVARVCHIGARRSRGHLKDEAEAERKAPTRSGSLVLSVRQARAPQRPVWRAAIRAIFRICFRSVAFNFGMGILMLVQFLHHSHENY
jgi:hypothetical protein